jgi:hypothetical protein
MLKSCQFYQDGRAIFAKLKAAGIRLPLDVRLNNVSQLTDFAKGGDLAFFRKEICGAEYLHEPMPAPTAEMLDGCRSKKRGRSKPGRTAACFTKP